MLQKNLTKVYLFIPKKINEYGEYKVVWKSHGEAFLNLQHDINELDRNSAGEIDYSIYKARTNRDYGIQNGFGISISNLDRRKNKIPEYRVLDHSIIGNTYMYRLEKYNGN